MFRGRTFAVRNSVVAALMATFGATSMPAQYGQTKEPQGNQSPVLTSNFVKTGLYMISGGGGNSLLRLSGNGLILVDGKLADHFDELQLRVNKIVDQPIRVVVNTDHYVEHTGTNAKFLARGIQVVAQENVKKNLISYNQSGEDVAMPSATYDREETLHFGLVEIQLLHFGNARTDGDTVVYFPNLRAIAVGDLYASVPNPDFSAGGSLVGWGPVLAEVLKLDFDVAVPGMGPPISRSDLEAFKTKIDAAVSRATELVKKGVPKDQLMGQLKTDDLGWHLNFSEKQLDGFYAELSRLK